MKKSIIYWNISFYRLLMSVLYLGKYKRRFERINALLKPTTDTVIELCFGDIYIAEYCKKNGIDWKGYDINEHFVRNATRLNYNAILKDVNELNAFEKCDTYIIIGSLYHFKDNSAEILRKMIASSSQVIISEPIKNISTVKGFIGSIASLFTNAGNGIENFRFNETTFLAMLDKLGSNYKIVSIDKDILIQITND